MGLQPYIISQGDTMTRLALKRGFDAIVGQERVDGGLFEPDAKTDGGGVATFETWVTSRSVTLRLPSLGRELTLLIGDLDPLATRSGVVGRLRNLGLYYKNAGGPEIEALPFRAVLLQFQEKYGLEQTGKPDQPTRDKLAELACDDGTWEEG